MIRLVEAKENDKLFANLLNCYLAELSRYNRNIVINKDGVYEPALAGELLNSPYCSYLVYDGFSPCGFVSVGKGNIGLAERCIAEFYVLPSMRRRGIGESAADLVFERHKGKYSLHVLKNNLPARRFWLAQMRRKKLTYAVGCDCEAADYLIFNV